MIKYVCHCGKTETTCSHTISQKRCKELHKTDLIWLEGNISWDCLKCHQEHESYRDGKFSYHKNAYQRMLFTAMHDDEGFRKRYLCITNEALKKKLENLFNEMVGEMTSDI